MTARWVDDPGEEYQRLLVLADELGTSRPLLHLAVYPTAMRARGDEPSVLHRFLARLGYTVELLGGDGTEREEWLFVHPDGGQPGSRWDGLGVLNGTDKAYGRHDYLRRYERLMEARPVAAVLEVGVDRGHSLNTWADVWPGARVVGVDVRPECAAYATDRVEVIVGDATSAAELAPLREHAWDLIIDDGSHQLDDQRATLALLAPALNPGGCYIVEDVPWDAQTVTDVDAAVTEQGLWPVAVLRSGAGHHAAVVARARP